MRVGERRETGADAVTKTEAERKRATAQSVLFAAMRPRPAPFLVTLALFSMPAVVRATPDAPLAASAPATPAALFVHLALGRMDRASAEAGTDGHHRPTRDERRSK